MSYCPIQKLDRIQSFNYQRAVLHALIYGEAQAAESPADFIHKIKLVLKEIRESRVSLRIIIEKPVIKNDLLLLALMECNELMAIFLKSIETAKKNNQKI